MKDLMNSGGKNDSDGLLSLDTSKVIIKTDSIKDVYDVEHSPFARGKFATVRKCKHKETGIEYAAKFIRKRRRAVDVRHEILHEIAVLEMTKSCHHIVDLIDVYETNSELILVLELVAGGELQRVIDEEETINEDNVVRFMKQILEGVSYLHDNKIAHLDIKPQNLLLTGTFPNCDIKLCDFGISRLICGDVEIREIVGTPDYIAPEVLHYEPISVETDMWSIGILAYVLLSGHSPFGGDTKQETFCNITQSDLEFPADLFRNVSCEAKKFIQSVLIRDPKLRPSVKECLKHSWLTGNGSENGDAIDSGQSDHSVEIDPCPLSTKELNEINSESLSSDTSSMDSSIVDSGAESATEELNTPTADENTLNETDNTNNSLSSNNETPVVTPTSSPREIINIKPAEKSKPEVQIPKKLPIRDVPSRLTSRLPERKLSPSFKFRDNKENIRLIRTRVAPPPVIHSLSPSLNVRAGYVKSAINSFTSGRSMSNLSPGKSLSSLLTPTKTRSSSVTRSSGYSSSYSTGTKTSLSSRKIKISSDETELRISKTSVVVIDEGVCF